MSYRSNSDMKTDIHNCQFDFLCAKQWDELALTEHADVRCCGECQSLVYFCETTEAFALAIEQDKCVAIDVEADIETGTRRLLGWPSSFGG